MSKKFLVNIDMGGNQIISPVIHQATGNPTGYSAGQLYYNTTASTLYFYNGSAWSTIAGGPTVASLNSFSGSVNIYGTTNQVTVTNNSGSITLSLPSTISVTTACATNFYGALTGNATGVTGATSTNTNSAYVVRDASGRAQFTDPSAAQDAATKNYVDTVAQGLNAHDAVTVVSTSNLSATYANGTADASGGLGIGATLTATANGTLTIDNVLLNVNDRVLVKGQTTGLQNGIYTVTASGAAGASWVLTRASDADNSIAGEMANGDFIFVISGSTGAGTGWVLNSASTSGTPTKAIKIGTDIVTYTQFSGQGTYTAGNGISISGNTFSVNAGTGFAFSGGSLVYGSGTTSQTATGVSGGTYSYGTQKQVATITGNGSLNSFVIAHNLNSRDVNVRVYQTSATPDTQWADVEVDVIRNATGSVTVNFASNVANGDTYNVVITG